MNDLDFNKIKVELVNVAKTIKTKWGAVQNNEMDFISNKIFLWESVAEMEKDIGDKNDKIKNYARRRWFVYKCALCDEYLFKKYGAQPNPNPKDKNWDFQINDVKFDHKGTKLPNELTYEQLQNDPQSVINWLYENQSKEQRYGEQNRLFIIHLSLIDRNRDDLLRCPLPKKEQAIKSFVENFKDAKLFDYKNAKATFLVIEEYELKKIKYWFPKN